MEVSHVSGEVCPERNLAFLFVWSSWKTRDDLVEFVCPLGVSQHVSRKHSKDMARSVMIPEKAPLVVECAQGSFENRNREVGKLCLRQDAKAQGWETLRSSTQDCFLWYIYKILYTSPYGEHLETVFFQHGELATGMPCVAPSKAAHSPVTVPSVTSCCSQLPPL